MIVSLIIRATTGIFFQNKILIAPEIPKGVAIFLKF